jgi:hypothetical protein
MYLDTVERSQAANPREIPGADVVIKYINEAIKYEMAYELGGIGAEYSSPDALPNWFISWENLNKHASTWVSASEADVFQFQRDGEFLRGIPNIDSPSGLNIFPSIPSPPVKSNERPLTSDYVANVTLSVLRGLGPRSTRLSQKGAPRRVESGEEAGLKNTLLFPLSEQASIGSIRSGRFANDIAHSHSAKQTLAQIFERLDGIPDVPTAGGIISVGEEGNTQGNIPLDDWLRGQPLYPLGLADASVSLVNYGLSNVEFNVDQQAVLVDKIQMYRALIKQFITEIREASTKEISQLQSEPNPLLTEEAAANLLEILQSEPILASRIEEFRHHFPIYKNIDIAIFAALMINSSDLVLTTLAQIPASLAHERVRAVRAQFQEALQQALAKTLKREMAGMEPVPNECAHVLSYSMIQKIKDDSIRMQTFAKFLTKFQGKRQDNWVDCGVCSKHLVCYHEVLLLQEFQHPREKDALHKELLLTFSGGQFHGGYMCKNCGQRLAELEFETSMEFSDDGTPMSGRAVMEDGDEQDGVDVIMNAQIIDDELKFETDSQKIIYKSARRLFDMVGVSATQTSYMNIVGRVDAELSAQASREQYKQLTKGKRAMDYDDFISRIMVSAIAANVLVEIQTNIPGYVVRSTISGCRAGFSGYPVGNEKDQTGMEYISCAVAAIQNNEAPWNMTGFQRESEKKRQESVLALVNKLMTKTLNNAVVQQQIAMKRAHLKEIYGSATYSEQLPEQIPHGFLPFLYAPEQMTEAVIVPQAASPSQLIRAWVLQAHREGKENGIYMKGNPYSEATCCLEPISEPGSFWKKKAPTMATLPFKMPPRGPIRSHLGLSFRPRANPELEGFISPEVIYKIFLKVCYTGPRIGLPHQPGYTNECASCGFVYPENPYEPRPIPPMSSNRATQKAMMDVYEAEVNAIVTKGKVALETQNIKVDELAFNEVIDASHKAFNVPEQRRTAPLAGMKLFESFMKIQEPFEGWKAIIAETIDNLSRLTPNSEEIDFVQAYGPMSSLATVILTEFQNRLGPARTKTLEDIFKGEPNELVESVRTYFLIPFQRLATGFDYSIIKSSFNISIGISPETKNDIKKDFEKHLNYLDDLSRIVSSGSTREANDSLLSGSGRSKGPTHDKLKWAVARLSEVLGLLKTSIRMSYISGGTIGLPYMMTVLIGGILLDFINPNIMPPGTDAEVNPNSRGPQQILDVCLGKLQEEGLKFTPEKIREVINQRAEIEKKAIIRKLDKLTPEEKRAELTMKRLGLGDWAVGGTKAIYKYDAEQYERERVQRIDMGFGETVMGGGQGQEEGYNFQQIEADDY